MDSPAGTHDRVPEWNRRRFSEREKVSREFGRFRPTGKVLELVCGTGPWTEEPPRYVASVTAVDASPEVLKINRARPTQNHLLYAFGQPRT